MKKVYLLSIIILAAAVLFAFFYSFSVQKISTERTDYSPGENIRFHLSSFKVYGCSCDGPFPEIYRYENGWKKLDLNTGLGSSCVDGEYGPVGMGCDVISCSFFQNNVWDYSWDQKYFESMGTTENCKLPEGLQLAKPLNAFLKATAGLGQYKFKYGNAESIFYIRGV